MSYSEAEAEVLLFSSSRNELSDFNSQFREKIDKKGAQYEGPMPFPVVTASELVTFLQYINDPDSGERDVEDEFPEWLFDVISSEKNRNAIIEAAQENRSLFMRKYRILGTDDIKSLLSFSPPDSVFVAIKLGHRRHTKGEGHDPPTWDPNADHIPSHPDGW